MDNLIRFHCPTCQKKLKAPPAFIGRSVKCSRPGCGLTLRVPGEVFNLDDDADEVLDLGPGPPMELDPPYETELLRPGRLPVARRVGKRLLPRVLALGVGVFLVLFAAGYGVYWWVGQPSAEQRTQYEHFLTTGNELIALHRASTTPSTLPATKTKLRAKAEENLAAYKQIQGLSPRKRQVLDEQYRAELTQLESDHIQLIVDGLKGKHPVLIVWIGTEPGSPATFRTNSNGEVSFNRWVPDTTGKPRSYYDPEYKGSFEVVCLERSNGGSSGSSGGDSSGAPTDDPATRIAKLAGTWDADDFSLVIEPDGKGQAAFGVSNGSQYTVLIGYYTITIKNGEPNIAFELTAGNKTLDYEFTVLSSSNANQLVVKEITKRVSANPITMKRRGMDDSSRPNDKKAADVPRTTSGKLGFSDLKITRTTFDPPSVEFTIRLDLAGGDLLEAWASVGIADAGKTLTIFAGALDQGLLEVNGINFSKPDPALKAQRVTMKRSANDPTLYVCSVRYPKLVLADAETEFTIVAAVEKDKEIVKTDAAVVRVNLRTGKVLSKP